MVTVGTWNLENLFRPTTDAGPDSDEAYDAKLTALAATITELAPDILAVQEVGQPEALSDLVIVSVAPGTPPWPIRTAAVSASAFVFHQG